MKTTFVRGCGQGHLTHYKFWGNNHIFGMCETRHLVMILKSTIGYTIDYPRTEYVQGHMTSLNFEK